MSSFTGEPGQTAELTSSPFVTTSPPSPVEGSGEIDRHQTLFAQSIVHMMDGGATEGGGNG